MKKQEELVRDISDMMKDTKAGRIHWDIKVQTTEYQPLENKPRTIEDGIEWIVDECYVSYHCEYKGKEFLMITYEMIHTSAQETRTTNLVFLPPLGIRYFDLQTLLPYSMETDKMVTYSIHQLWLQLLELQKNKDERITFEVSERTLTIDEE